MGGHRARLSARRCGRLPRAATGRRRTPSRGARLGAHERRARRADDAEPARLSLASEQRREERLSPVRERRYQEQAIAFWRALALELRGHPAIVGYNILNEPRPERAQDTREFDLSAFYARVVDAVREVDPEIPIVLDAGDDAGAAAFERLRPIDDAAVLYAFHMYEPWAFIDHVNDGSVRYPGPVPDHDAPAGMRVWDARVIHSHLDAVTRWQSPHRVGSSRIFAEEFGVPRTHPGAREWLTDVVAEFADRRRHWAFYSFREDTWPGMDYELGATPLPAGYWDAAAAGHAPELPRTDNPI